MANLCSFDIKIAGPEQAVREFVSMMRSDGAYKNDGLGRIYSFNLDEGMTQQDPKGQDYISVQGFGDCAWSILSAMRESGFSRNLEDESERLGLVVEAFSSEPGIGFQEHLLINKGDIVIDDCVDYEEHLIEGASEKYIQELLEEKAISHEELMKSVDCNGCYCLGGFENFCEFSDLFCYLDEKEKASLDDKIQECQNRTRADSILDERGGVENPER